MLKIRYFFQVQVYWDLRNPRNAGTTRMFFLFMLLVLFELLTFTVHIFLSNCHVLRPFWLIVYLFGTVLYKQEENKL